MNKCVSCNEEGELICFCSKSIYCSSCIGSHLIEVSDCLHKPVALSDSNFTQLVSESWQKLVESEQRILADAEEGLFLRGAIEERVKEEVEAVQAFQSLCFEFVSDFKRDLFAKIEDSLQEITEKIQDACQTAEWQLSEAADAIQTGNIQYNELADELNSISSIEELSEKAIIDKNIDFKDIDIHQIIKSAFVLKVNILHRRRFRLNQSLPTLLIPGFISGEKSPKSARAISFSMIDNDNENRDISYTMSKDLSIDDDPVVRRRSFLFEEDQFFQTPLYWIDSQQIHIYYISNKTHNTVKLPTPGLILNGAIWAKATDNNLYITGGKDSFPSHSAWMFNALTKELNVISSMLVPRHNHVVLSLGKQLYVIGGCNRIAIKDCERYSLVKKTWKKIGGLNIGRQGHAGIVHNMKIYIAGGAKHDDIEIYNKHAKSFCLFKLKIPIPGKCMLFSDNNRILILHEKKIVEFENSKNNMQIVSNLGRAFWSPCHKITQAHNSYFIDKGVVYKFDLEDYTISVITQLTNN